MKASTSLTEAVRPEPVHMAVVALQVLFLFDTTQVFHSVEVDKHGLRR